MDTMTLTSSPGTSEPRPSSADVKRKVAAYLIVAGLALAAKGQAILRELR